MPKWEPMVVSDLVFPHSLGPVLFDGLTTDSLHIGRTYWLVGSLINGTWFSKLPTLF